MNQNKNFTDLMTTFRLLGPFLNKNSYATIKILVVWTKIGLKRSGHYTTVKIIDSNVTALTNIMYQYYDKIDSPIGTY